MPRTPSAMASGSSNPVPMQIEGSEGGAPSEQSALDRLAWKPFERREAAKRQAEPAWHEYTSVVFVTGKQGEQVPHKDSLL